MSTSASQFAIVVPVYNVIQYLPEFLDSLDKQTSKAFFVIAVDDGSTDRGGLVLDRFSAAHPWLTVVHLPNAGVSAARNQGLDIVSQVKGVKYLSFVDSDDVLDPDYVASFTESLERTGADLALCPYTDFDRKKKLRKSLISKKSGLTRMASGRCFLVTKRQRTKHRSVPAVSTKSVSGTTKSGIIASTRGSESRRIRNISSGFSRDLKPRSRCLSISTADGSENPRSPIASGTTPRGFPSFAGS